MIYYNIKYEQEHFVTNERAIVETLNAKQSSALL